MGSKQSVKTLRNEKNEMYSKVRSTKKKLKPWQTTDLERISNDMDYNFFKGFTRKFNGYIKTLDNERLISFRRMDRGFSNTTTKIVAISSEFEIHLDQRAHEIYIELDGVYLGKIVNNTNLIDPSGVHIGTLNQDQNSSAYYFVQTNNEKLAIISKNSDRRTFIKNPHYERYPTSSFEKDLLWEKDVQYRNLMKLYRKPNENEYKWLLAIVIYEAVYYGIDFTQ